MGDTQQLHTQKGEQVSSSFWQLWVVDWDNSVLNAALSCGTSMQGTAVSIKI